MIIIYVQNGDVAADSLAREDAARRYPGERVGGRNPQFYEASTAAPVRDATAVYVRRYWARILADYAGWGIPVHVLEELAAPAPAVAVAPVAVAAPVAPDPSPPIARRGPGRPPNKTRWPSP